MTGTEGLQRVEFYLIKGNFGIGMLGFVASGLELAVDSNVGILVETGIALETGFGLGAAFDDREIMVKEAESPFEGFASVGMLKRMGLALGLLDEFAVGYASCRPGLGEMVGIELEKTLGVRHSTDYDVLFVTATCFDGVHRAPVVLITRNRHKIAHSSGARCGIGRERDIMVNNAAQIDLNACF